MSRLRFAPLLLLAWLGPVAAQPVYVLTAAEWSGPRSGERVLAMDGLGAAVREAVAAPGRGLLLRYPGGDEGSLWVEELRSWLLALGLDPDRIEARPGSPADDVIELEVVQHTHN